MNNDGWQEVSAGGGSNAQRETWKPNKNDELMGVYLDTRDNVGPNKSSLYIIQKPDGTEVTVWGNAMLDANFKRIQLGSEVKLVYLGKETNEKSGRSYHNYKIYSRRPASATTATEADNEDVSPDDIPF